MTRFCKCGQVLKPAKPSAILRGRGRYCSRSCAGKAQGPHEQRGESNPNWKGGISSAPGRSIKKKREYSRKFPGKDAAHRLVTNAIRRGDLVRVPCVVCGDPKSEAHHEDYSKPLEVVWYCKPHHHERHVQIRRAEVSKKQSPLDPCDVAILGGDPSL